MDNTASGKFDEKQESPLRFHRASLWNSIFVRTYEKGKYLPDFRFLDIVLYRDNNEGVSFLAPMVDIRDIAACNKLTTLMPLHGSQDIVTLSRHSEQFCLARAMPVWRSLVIFTRAARAGYGAIVHGRAMWLQPSQDGLSGQSPHSVPAIEARRLAYFSEMSPRTLDILLSAFVTAGIVGFAAYPTLPERTFYYIQPGVLQVLPDLVGRDYAPVSHVCRPSETADAFPAWCNA